MSGMKSATYLPTGNIFIFFKRCSKSLDGVRTLLFLLLTVISCLRHATCAVQRMLYFANLDGSLDRHDNSGLIATLYWSMPKRQD